MHMICIAKYLKEISLLVCGIIKLTFIYCSKNNKINLPYQYSIYNTINKLIQAQHNKMDKTDLST